MRTINLIKVAVMSLLICATVLLFFTTISDVTGPARQKQATVEQQPLKTLKSKELPADSKEKNIDQHADDLSGLTADAVVKSALKDSFASANDSYDHFARENSRHREYIPPTSKSSDVADFDPQEEFYRFEHLRETLDNYQEFVAQIEYAAELSFSDEGEEAYLSNSEEILENRMVEGSDEIKSEGVLF